MSSELQLTGVADGWTKVEHSDGVEYVSHVKIAGVELELDQISEADVTCDEWSIVRDYYPALLIEAPEWYTPPEDTDE